MQTTSPAETYKVQLQAHQQVLLRLQQKRSRLGWARFAVFIATGIIAYIVFVEAGLWGLLPLIIGLIGLIVLVFIDADNNRSITHTKTLIGINEEELAVLNHQYLQRFNGSDYTPAEHAYANDLDLFGQASLFQYINRSASEDGRSRLAQNLLEPLPLSRITERQGAVKELAPLVEWRQELQAIAAQTPVTAKTRLQIKEWLATENAAYTHPFWAWFVPLYSILTIASLVASLIGIIPVSLLFTLFSGYYIFSLLLSRNAMAPYVQLSGIVKEVNTLEAILHCVESRSFTSPLLLRLQEDAQVNGTPATRQIRSLKGILDRFDVRLNVFVFIFLNSLLLWEVRQVRQLNSWRLRNKPAVPHWFELLAEIEVLNSLATLHFNQPSWCFPTFSSSHFTLNGTAIAHPLIPAGQRVANDFDLEGKPRIGLITGSNMAGKSTFLRSLGVNIILAQTGAPVCAQSFRLSPVRLMSSMRIADNLAENTSTFYAELKKLKTIIEAVNRHETVFILLDEILRGTNSLDRHTGSKALINQLIKEGAVAVLATHDVELAALQHQHPTVIDNYHFDVQVEGEELYFDYKLKEGVCTSLNASVLMKKIGIQLS